MHATTNQLVPIALIARQLRVPVKWLRAQADAGRIPHIRAGNQILAQFDGVHSALLARVSKSQALGAA